jgi:hypothetical protein
MSDGRDLSISLIVCVCVCVQPMDDPERSLPFIAKILRTLRAEVCGPHQSDNSWFLQTYGPLIPLILKDIIWAP